MSAPEAEVEPLTIVRYGLTCEDCFTSSGLEIDVVKIDDDGAEVVITLEGCRRCRTGVCRDE